MHLFAFKYLLNILDVYIIAIKNPVLEGCGLATVWATLGGSFPTEDLGWMVAMT